MTIQPNELLQFAQELLWHENEVAWRTSCSRAYYAACQGDDMTFTPPPPHPHLC
ncbi:MAG: hypothetical protein HQL53_04270 [Magnetococcales bacterium]|nr:hypothetical protein [Magnetococcales bacterium]